MFNNIEIGQLWNKLIAHGYKSYIHKGDYELINVDGIEIQTYGNKFVKLLKLSRHKTSKHLVQIVVEQNSHTYEVIVTTDHVCMIYNKDHFFENTNAKNLKCGQFVSVYDKDNDIERIGTIVKISDLGITDDYVYDCEVDDDMHSFYANDILIHNSQFINLDCVSTYLRNKRNLGKSIRKWKLDDRKVLWKIISQFVEKEVNPFVRNMVHDFCGTSQQDVLTYELEYMGDTGIYEGKKHYAVHKIFEEGDVVDKTKYCGIELKKAQVPKKMKDFLAEIYDGVITKEWGETEYNNYVNDLYNRFKQFTIDEISLWKGYSSERQAIGFLQMATGTTGIAKACTYYNQIIDKLGLGKKYDHIRVGAKTRFCYLKSSNKFGIDCIAYLPDQWPKEFNELFEVDYHVMFNKIILDPLKRFREACNFEDSDPSKQVEFDIFSL